MTFKGFGARDKPTYLPESFFSELLPLIDDLAELKVTLFCMWALQQREGRYRYLTHADFAGDAALMDGLRATAPNAAPADTLAAALERAIERGALLRAEISRSDGVKQALYLMNTERGREAADAIATGRYEVIDTEQVEILPPRPNIYRLYEQEIGVLTPMIADGLKDLERDYPAAWLPEAIKVAAEKQAKNLQFIRAVLERWRKEGKTDDEIRGRQESVGDAGDGRRFVSGRYADYIDH